MMEKVLWVLMSWEFFIALAIGVVVAALMMGCSSTSVSTTVGDTEYTAGIYLEKDKKDEE
jgi:hypothetical protein